jgi:hypothetical protein
MYLIKKNMKKLFAILSFVAISGTVLAQSATPAADNQKKGEFKFEKEIHDFGSISEGEMATYEFTFTNTGKEPLIISNVAASCGCTTPSWTREPVKPGEKGSIKAVYNSANRPGPFTKQVTITSNGKTPTKVLTIKGVVDRQPSGVPEIKNSGVSPVTKP